MFRLPDLNYEYDALEPFISKRTVDVHYNFHHQGYVNKLNELLQKIYREDISDIVLLIRNIDIFPIEYRDDILYNAFLQVYSGYFESAGSVGCTNNSIKFSANYIDLRIQNIFGKDTGYNLTDFTVPTGSFSDYIGAFKYDSSNDQFIYYGNCKAE